MDWRSLDVFWDKSCGFVQWQPGKKVSQQWFDRFVVDFDLWLFTGGQGYLRTKDEVISLHRGVVVLLSPGVAVEAWQEGGKPVETYWLHFDLFNPKRKGKLDRAALGDPPHWHESFQVAFYEENFKKLIAWQHEMNHLQPEDRVKLERMGGDLILLLLREFQHRSGLQSRPLPVGIELRHRLLVERLQADLYSNPERHLSCQSIAKEYGYSLDHLGKLFKAITGLTLSEALITARVEKAKALLRHTGWSVGEISAQTGYESVFYFSRQFRQRTGVTPTQYRQKQGELQQARGGRIRTP